MGVAGALGCASGRGGGGACRRGSVSGGTAPPGLLRALWRGAAASPGSACSGPVGGAGRRRGGTRAAAAMKFSYRVSGGAVGGSAARGPGSEGRPGERGLVARGSRRAVSL